MASALTTRSDWIHDVCRRFSRATGWSLVYSPAEEVAAAGGADAIRNSPECCWFAELRDGQTNIGLLHIELPHNTRHDRRFPAVRELAELIAQTVNKYALAVHQLESRTREVSTLVDIGRSLPNEADLLSALKQLLRAAVSLTEFRSAAFFLLSGQSEHLHLRVAEGLAADDVPHPFRQLSQNPPDLNALSSRRLVLHRKPHSHADQWLPAGLSTAVCLAVESESDSLGTLWVFDRRLRVPSEREYHVLESIAVQLAAVLERAVLLQESAAKHRLQRDLDAASASQARDVLGELPRDIGIDVAAACTSRYELGGDLCELIPVEGRRTIIAVGDASGDSVPAAMVMSSIRGALRTLSMGPLEELVRTESVVEKLNRALYQITPAHQFMSLLYGVLDVPRGVFRYSNAGHPVPILFRAGESSSLNSHGMLLGVVDDSSYDSSTIQLQPGDMLVFYSDGISEAMNRRRKMFRSDGIIGAVQKYATQPARDIVQAIWCDLEAHLGDGVPDDRTLLVVKMPRG